MISGLKRALAWAVLVLLLSHSAMAQGGSSPQGDRAGDVTRAHAITNTRVIQAPGQILERATVVIRDGVITAVGTDVAVPFDARVIEGDSLYVYAAFIDAFGTAGLDVPDVDTSERVSNPDDPPRDRAGILPDRRARDYFDPTGRDVERLREAGFAVAHVAPEYGMLSGQSAVVLLDGARAEHAIITSDHALVARFAAASGVFPATPMAVAAALREAVRRSRQHAEVVERYRSSPPGRSRPAFDPVAEAIGPAVAGDQPVFFAVRDALEADRALRLMGELELSGVLAGLPEASMLVDRLRAAGVSVIAPIALPDTLQADEGAPALAEVSRYAGTVYPSRHRTRSQADTEAEEAVLKRRQRVAVALRERNPQTLAEAGIPFALATLGESPSMMQGSLRRMMAAGLSADDALGALTTTPARLLGLERTLGTVEAGKMANLLVTDGDYFADGTSVRYVFVEGRRHDFDAADRPEEDPDADEAVLGTWDASIVAGDISITATMGVTGDPSAPSVSMESPEIGRIEVTDVRLVGNRLSFVLPDTPVGRIEVSGVVDGDAFDAEVLAPGAPGTTFTATRRPDGSR